MDPAPGLRAQPGSPATRDLGAESHSCREETHLISGVCCMAVPAGPVMEQAAPIETLVPSWESCFEPEVHPFPTHYPGLSLWEHPGPLVPQSPQKL